MLDVTASYGMHLEFYTQLTNFHVSFDSGYYIKNHLKYQFLSIRQKAHILLCLKNIVHYQNNIKQLIRKCYTASRSLFVCANFSLISLSKTNNQIFSN